MTPKKQRNPDLLAIFFYPKKTTWGGIVVFFPPKKKKLKVEKSGMSFTMIRVENLEKLIFGKLFKLIARVR